jgi:hypothetical protein
MGPTLRRLLVLALVAAAVILPAEAARACSCGIGDPRDEIARADAAVVGVVTDPGGFLDGDATIRVEHDLKGNLPDEIEVGGLGDGASCGLSFVEGQRVGLLLDLDGGGWSSNLCAEREPEVLLAASGPLPATDGQGPVAYLVGGSIGQARLVALDRAGRTLAYGYGEGTTYVISVCPEGRLVLEGGSDGDRSFVEGRVLESFEVVRRIRLGDLQRPRLVACVDPAGRRAVVMTSRGLSAEVFLVGPGDERLTLFEGRADDAVVAGDEVFVAMRDGRLRVIDLDGRVVATHQLPELAIGGAVSPDGAWFGAVTYGDGDDDSSTIELLDLRTGATVEAPLDAWNVIGRVRWIDEGTFVFLPGQGDEHDAIVFDTTLRELSRFPRWYTYDSDVVDGRAVGVGWGVLMRAALPGGPVKVLRDFENPEVMAFAPAPPGVELSEAARSAEPPIDATEVSLEGDTSGEGADGSSGLPWWLVGLVAAAVAGVVALLVRRRRARAAGA